MIKEVSDEMLAWKTEGTRLYRELPARLHETLRACEPLREVPADRPDLEQTYRSWGSR